MNRSLDESIYNSILSQLVHQFLSSLNGIRSKLLTHRQACAMIKNPALYRLASSDSSANTMNSTPRIIVYSTLFPWIQAPLPSGAERVLMRLGAPVIKL